MPTALAASSVVIRVVRQATIWLWAASGLLATQLPSGADSPEVLYPRNAPGVMDVKRDFSAKGDGLADDTKAIKAAFTKLSYSGDLLYFPNGTYLVSDQVWFACWCGAQGQSRGKVIIKLKDNCPGFQDPKVPKAVVGTVDPGSRRQSCLNMNFSTYFINFTIDTGKGNAGAIALEYMSHNGGCAENLILRSGDGAGSCGLAMDRLGPGPSMCKNVSIQGFDYGIITEGNCYQSTFEDIRLSGQNVAGWLNTDHPLAVRKLVSRNAVPAVLCRKTTAWRHSGPDAKGGFFVMLDSELTGGTAAAAVDIQDGAAFLRNVRVDGYKAAVNDKGTVVPAGQVEEYSSQPWDSAIRRTLGLPVKDTPRVPWYGHEEWVSVQDYRDKVTKDGDWSPAFQAAVDGGKAVVFVPKGRYVIKKTVHLRGKARVLLGTVITSVQCAKTGEPTFLFDDPDPNTLFFIDRIRFEGDNGWTKVVHASPGTLVVLHGLTIMYSNRPGCGEFYMEDMCGGVRFEHPQKAWIRQLNCEGRGLKVLNRAADLWIMGYKTESTGIELHNGPTARTEILGGNHFAQCYNAERFNQDTGPMYLNEEGGAFSAVVALEWTKKLMVKDMRGGKETTILSGTRPGQRRWLLYTSTARPEPAAEEDPAGRSLTFLLKGITRVSVDRTEPNAPRYHFKATEGDTDRPANVFIVYDGYGHVKLFGFSVRRAVAGRDRPVTYQTPPPKHIGHGGVIMRRCHDLGFGERAYTKDYEITLDARPKAGDPDVYLIDIKEWKDLTERK